METDRKLGILLYFQLNLALCWITKVSLKLTFSFSCYFSLRRYFLPGGKLRPGESSEDGLRRKLSSKLSPIGESEEGEDWEIGDVICKWWAIDFSQAKYPYIPAHVTKPKELLQVHLVTMPEIYRFAVPKNLQLVAVPLFELLSRVGDFGPVIASVPALIGKYHINYVESQNASP